MKTPHLKTASHHGEASRFAAELPQGTCLLVAPQPEQAPFREPGPVLGGQYAFAVAKALEVAPDMPQRAGDGGSEMAFPPLQQLIAEGPQGLEVALEGGEGQFLLQ